MTLDRETLEDGETAIKKGSRMKRDMELVRKILLFVEGIDNIGSFKPLVFDGYKQDAIIHNVQILVDAGFLTERYVSLTTSGMSVTGGAITYEGHDFLDAARNDTIWRKALEKISSVTGSVSLDVLKAVLIDFGKKALDV